MPESTPPRSGTVRTLLRLLPFVRPALPRIYLGMLAALLAGLVALGIPLVLQSLAALRADVPGPPPPGLPIGTGLPVLFENARAQLVGAGITNVAAFPLGGEKAGIAVARLLAHGLEDRATNRHWRPGPRATGAMIGLW